MVAVPAGSIAFEKMKRPVAEDSRFLLIIVCLFVVRRGWRPALFLIGK